MKLVNSIFIRRPAAAVWAFIEKPENLLRWNPKVKRVLPPHLSKPRQGYRYAISYQMSNKAVVSNFQAEFVIYQPPAKLLIRHTEGSARASDRVIDEIYELKEMDGGCLLKQTIHVKNSGINIFLRLLLWLVQTLGKPTGKPYLADLRDILEGDVTEPVAAAHNSDQEA